MSCYEWEKGSFTLSTEEFPKFQKTFIQHVNECKAKDYKILCDVYEKLIDSKKGKDANFYFSMSLQSILNEQIEFNRHLYRSSEQLHKFFLLDDYDIQKILLKDETPRRPTKSANPELAPLTLNTQEICFGEASVIFDRTKRLVKDC